MRRALKYESAVYTELEEQQCEGGSNIVQYTSFNPVLEPPTGNLKLVCTTASKQE